MAFQTVKAGVRNQGNLIEEALRLIEGNNFATLQGNESYAVAQNNFASVFGGEGFNNFQKGFTANLSQGGYAAAVNSINRTDYLKPIENYITPDVLKDLNLQNGLEGFSLNNFKGQSQETKAVNIVLNTQTRLQTKAAEELYKTISVRYEDEGVRMTTRAAGVGSYVVGATAWESMVELTPIFAILRNGDIFKDDLLGVYPVLPSDPDDADTTLFVDSSVRAPVDKAYSATDAYGRQPHLTQMLAVPGTVNNLLGLCTAPQQRPWTDTDEIESSSIRIIELGFTAKLDGVDIQAFVPTEAMTNTNMSPTSVGQNSNDRDVDITIRHLAVTAMVDGEGNAAPIKEAFKAFYDKGYEPNLDIRLNGRYNRQSSKLELSTGQVVIASLTKLDDNSRINHSNATAEEKVLLRSLKAGVVNAATPAMNVTNSNNGNFGYRLDVFDSTKELTTRRQDPISVKYPVRPEDVNKEALDDAVSYMGVTIQTSCSKRAFESAFKHLNYLTSIDGAAVVNNENGGNDLPGRMYVRASTIHRAIRIQDHISAPENLDVFDNICALFLNEIQDITAALAFKSGIAAINEYSGIAKTKWSIIVHQNLARFLMRSGDSRITASEDFNIVETNFDSMVGRLLIVPQNDSTEDRINPLAGIGVNVAKENIVLHGNVTRGTVDFGVMMTMPCYMHWNLNCVIGSMTITDAEDFLGDEGVFYKLGGMAVKTNAGQVIKTDSEGSTGPTAPLEVKVISSADEPIFTKEGN